MYSLNGLTNFCNDMNFFEADTLNSLIRWIEYVYGGSPDCVNINYADTISDLQVTNWGNPSYPGQTRRKFTSAGS